ncbi:16S rRNA (cytosine(1402)-N(4))-methyltransferase RsmH [Mycoplasmopsis felis]|uniref:16S rRNA (cytosine(1402)-N(4))-methyltransferase RsmH n=1 Tax=Mycoplasmopsis felis TaxID=33923 RepID=UPI002AFFF125|nr:16S rRNA (cytosine(1402)-N(4))-methyltransferase RsmH [Mycoplasmopsis felis]WQQ03416.1 16S rRNA (cytosine(1402)-N(4))-methyltransferase RsmH [Mycoplasmopsis felis]WQQ05064.1 16S rRNA (cytosine(1402)-N(4))-methyltransferase RsmH [Mycoplasmopsis felis]WQQ08308.1 16S rRNA (cytosine(1402)-N(4))-methyltransferase RsmH [Mycoplasmopsis felis]WQQ11151.1 16S rRNA (cytosine(1402)-N(4))-methyltransferase RsmH [Mycoplasmopsis felis]WRX06423.1 16S rRNA (cytosine(1402)-N(4))-methyltransferase RsmH [Mycop
MNDLHYSVMLNETIDSLNIKEDGIYVDLTLGMGGHSEQILKRLKTGHLYAFDKDDFALNYSKNRLSKISNNFTLIKSDFRYFKEKLNNLNVLKVDGIIADLGVSSPQLDTPERGFSYNKDSVLDMRMDQTQQLTAYDIVNNYSVEKLVNIFKMHADVKLPKLVAKAIVLNRPINTTLELVDIIKNTYPSAILRQKHPAKTIFQAIRIEVNDELNSLKEMLDNALSLLNKNGTLSIITFHSIEDRIVSRYLKEISKSDIPSKMPIQDNKIFLTKKIPPSDFEVSQNRRSKSAKLRILKKLSES